MTVIDEDIYETNHLVRCHGCSEVVDLYEEPAFPHYRIFDEDGKVAKTVYHCESCHDKMSDYHKAKGVQSG